MRPSASVVATKPSGECAQPVLMDRGQRVLDLVGDVSCWMPDDGAEFVDGADFAAHAPMMRPKADKIQGPYRCDQRAAVQLADPAAGQFVDDVQFAGCRGGIQRRRDVVAQLGQRRCDGAGCDDDRGDHPLTQPVVGQPEDRAVRDRGMAGQHRLHRLRQHGQAAGADRVVDPAEHPQHARIIQCANIIGAEPAGLGERVGIRRIAVALGQGRAAQHDPPVVDSIRTSTPSSATPS